MNVGANIIKSFAAKTLQRFFKKKIGLTPLAFRRLHQNCQ